MKTQDELKELHGREYAENFEKTQSPLRLERLIKYMSISPEDNVVDFGCGSGMLMKHIAPLVNSYVGVDFSEPFIDMACARKASLNISNARFECSSIQDFCRRHRDSFNVAFAMDFSEHVYDEDWLEHLISMRTSLVSGGRLYLHTPNARFFLEIMKKHNLIVRQFPEHVAVRTLEENTSLLKKAGYRVCKAMLMPHYNILWLFHPLSFVPLVGDYLKARIFIEAFK